jgi:beta-phosphoglucomutase
MAVPKAFLFDLNGTMIDDMGYHQKAWYDILNDDLKAGLSREAVKKEMYGKNSELLVRVFGEGRFSEAEMDKWSMEKERRYQQAFLPELRLIAGLDAFLERAKKQGTLLAIGSAAINFNIDFVLDNLDIRHYFSAIVSADDVKISKPDPETYCKLAGLLNVKPSECLVFEDAPKGVEAAENAGMQSVVITTMHEPGEFAQYSNVWGYIQDYNDKRLDSLF